MCPSICHENTVPAFVRDTTIATQCVDDEEMDFELEGLRKTENSPLREQPSP